MGSLGQVHVDHQDSHLLPRLMKSWLRSGEKPWERSSG